MQIPKSLPGVPSEILNPRNTWADKADYDETLKMLAKKFSDNFKQYEKTASDAMKSANPKID